MDSFIHFVKASYEKWFHSFNVLVGILLLLLLLLLLSLFQVGGK